MRHAVVIERAKGNYSAYAPDLPGWVATGETMEEVEVGMREAISFHLDGLREDGLPIPAASIQVNISTALEPVFRIRSARTRRRSRRIRR
jgi:predicted RNase H-like HicB family nuclease